MYVIFIVPVELKSLYVTERTNNDIANTGHVVYVYLYSDMSLRLPQLQLVAMYDLINTVANSNGCHSKQAQPINALGSIVSRLLIG